MSDATSPALEVVPTGPLSGSLRAPSSKSVSNRLLVIAALASGSSRLGDVLTSDDTAVMTLALRQLGAGIVDRPGARPAEVEITGTAGVLTVPGGTLEAGLSGTTLRWLAAIALLVHGSVTLDGAPPLRRRPIKPLLDVLRRLGGDIESDGGRPPLKITSGGLRGGPVEIDAAQSSQFATSLLLAAPYADSDLSIEIANLGAGGYVELTVETMQAWGAEVRGAGRAGNPYVVTAGASYRGRHELVEYDASAAAHLFALAMATGGSVTVENAVATRQPDSRIVEVFEEMGATVSSGTGGGVSVRRHGLLSAVEVDVSAMPDQLPTLAVLGALADGTTSLRGVSVARGHETDRVAAVGRELSRLGAQVEQATDSLVVHGGRRLHSGEVTTYGDHRMAMALSALAAVVPGVVIADPGCVRKTYPDYWQDAARLGMAFTAP